MRIDLCLAFTAGRSLREVGHVVRVVIEEPRARPPPCCRLHVDEVVSVLVTHPAGNRLYTVKVWGLHHALRGCRLAGAGLLRVTGSQRNPRTIIKSSDPGEAMAGVASCAGISTPLCPARWMGNGKYAAAALNTPATVLSWASRVPSSFKFKRQTPDPSSKRLKIKLSTVNSPSLLTATSTARLLHTRAKCIRHREARELSAGSAPRERIASAQKKGARLLRGKDNLDRCLSIYSIVEVSVEALSGPSARAQVV